MKYSDEILGKEKMWKLVLSMTIPCIFAQIVNLLYSIIDRIYIGNMEGVGKLALAGVGLCTPIITFIAAFSGFISGGGAPLASRALGENKRDIAHKYLGNGTFLLIIFTFTLSIFSYIFKKPLLYFIGASENTFNYANDYLSIYLLGTLFVQISVGLNTFITAQGRSRLAMMSTLIGAITNIILDPIFIFLFRLEVKGAALATVISQGISAIFVLVILTNKNSSIRLTFSNLKPDISIIGNIIKLGIAQFVMAATESVIGFALNGQLKRYGGDLHVSNLAILQSCMMLITTPMTGFTQGVTPILSYNFGLKNTSRIKDCFTKTLLVCFSYASLLALIMIIFPYPFARMFTSDKELIKLTMTYLPIFISGMLIFGIQRACQTTFVSMGEALISLFIAILRKILLLVPFSFIFPTLPFFGGVKGVYIAECVADVMSATICFTIFIIRFRTIMKKTEACHID